MSRYESASHVFYRCQYHIVWKPKYGRVGQEVCRSIYIYSGMKRCRIVELNVLIDHVHLLVRLPPSL
ncbi:transposase, partial [Shewanella algae]